MERKQVLITGASSGIGKASVEAFLGAGFRVVATDKTAPSTEHEGVSSARLDLTWEARAIKRTIELVLLEHGPVDILLNNAGFGHFGAFEAASESEIREQFEVNLFGTMRVTRSLLPHFRARESGVIVNVSSAVGRVALPMQSLYNASKFALEGFSESLRYELRPFNIRVCLVEPGNVRTGFFASLSVSDTKGFEAYRRYQSHALERLVTHNRRGVSADDVARVVVRAATDPSDRPRYLVGWDARTLLALRACLPFAAFERVVRRVVEPPLAFAPASTQVKLKAVRALAPPRR